MKYKTNKQENSARNQANGEKTEEKLVVFFYLWKQNKITPSTSFTIDSSRHFSAWYVCMHVCIFILILSFCLSFNLPLDYP